MKVEDVNAKLEELEKQKQNGWVVEEKITTKKKVKVKLKIFCSLFHQQLFASHCFYKQNCFAIY